MGNCSSSDTTSVKPTETQVKKVVREEDEIDRAKIFKTNLKNFKEEHGHGALIAKYDTGMMVGQKSVVPIEAAMKSGKQRGSVQYDISPAYKEMKELLDDPHAQRYLGHWISDHHFRHVLFCWIDCSEYEIIPSVDFRRAKAIFVIKKYVNEKGENNLEKLLPEDLRIDYETLLSHMMGDHTLHTEKELFFPLSNVCFRELVASVLAPFKESKEFAAYKAGKHASLRIFVSDFDYMAILGQASAERAERSVPSEARTQN